MIMSQSGRQLQATPTPESLSGSSHKGQASLRHHQPSAQSDRHQSHSTVGQYAPLSKRQATPNSQQQGFGNNIAMQNLGQNPLQQQQQQLKAAQSNNINDTPWNNPANDNPDVRQSITCATMSANIDNINNNNNNNNVDNDTSPKIPRSDSTLTGPYRSLNRPPQHQPPTPQSQSQPYHGIFSPQIPASLQSTLFATRVDQIIRTTLHDSPAYTPPSSKNSNTPTNNLNATSGIQTSTSSSNMPSPSPSLMYNQASNAMAPISSSPAETPAHPPNTSGGTVSANASPSAIGFGPKSTLQTTSDMSNNNGANSNHLPRAAAHSSASHSALAAAAALQSLNQSHFQRSQPQLAAHTQQAPFLNAAPSLTTSKPAPLNASGSPVPQAAHGNSSSSSNHMPKLCITASTANSFDNGRPLLFTNDRSDNQGDFGLRIQPNNASNSTNNSNNKMPPHTSAISNLPLNWQENATNPNGSIPRMMSTHSGANSSLPHFATSSSPYALINAHMPIGLNSSNNAMINQEGDTLSRFNALRNQNPHQLNDENNGAPNFSLPMMKPGGNAPTIDLMRLQQTTPGADRKLPLSHPGLDNRSRITESEKQAIFSYNLLSPLIPGSSRSKDIVHLDDEMRKSILNSEFYTKYEHIATGILTNTILVPNFSIIDYLRQIKMKYVPPPELERIEEVNRKLSMSDYSSLMELIRQKPLYQLTSKVAGIEADRPLYGDLGQFGIPNMSFNPENLLNNHSGNFMRNNPLMSSPNRNEIATFQGLENSHRSSQSPSDITRSHVGCNVNHSKFFGVPNQFLGIHNSPHSSSTGTSQYGPSPYSTNQQRNHQPQTSPQAHRHSPFQQPLGVCPPINSRPPRSHSTIGGLNIGPLNTTFNAPAVRQPPAAHQSSSRPNLSALASEFLAHNAQPNTVPVTAHISSKTPQTLRPPENLINLHPSSTKPQPFVNGSYVKAFGSRELAHSNQSDQPSLIGRQDIDSMHGIPIQTLLSLRQHEINSRELATKRSITPQYGPPSVSNIAPVGSIVSIDVSRQSMIENYGSESQLQSQSNNPLGLSSISSIRNPKITNSNLVTHFHQTMPPPGAPDHRLSVESMSRVVSLAAPNPNLGDSQTNQNNSTINAYQQQQILLSNKLIDNGPGALPPSNITNRSSGPNQYLSQKPKLDELISVDTAQGRHLAQTGSPKSNNQRSIITGNASTGVKKTKKTKLSPSTSAQVVSDKASCTDSSQSIVVDEKPYNAHQHDLQNEASLRAISTITSSEARSLNDLQPSTRAVKSPAARGLEISINTHQENKTNIGNIKSANLTSASSLPNISEQSFSSGEKYIDESGLLESDTKLFNCTNDTSFQDNNPAEPSKYQKLFTKKAWLKNYDEEDQARSTEAASSVISDELKDPTESAKNIDRVSDQPDNTINSSHLSVIKPNAVSKNGKLAKPGNKKKLKEGREKKVNSIASVRPRPTSNEGCENDSEGTTASTSDLDDTDETDSMKSTNDKKLRRMPRRKVKSNSERDLTESVKEIKSKVIKDTKDKLKSKKRGKKEKSETINLKRKYNSDDESVNQKTKKIKHEGDSSLNLKKRPNVEFLQRQSCYEIVPKAIRCLECRKVRQLTTKGDKAIAANQASKSNWDAFCRFYDFRKLHYNKAGQIVVAGFCSASDATNSDKQLWLPTGDIAPKNITYRVAKYILENIGDEFCKLVQRERIVINAHDNSGDTRATWKRVVDGMRELCDVCNTTLFNCHHVCERCGFVICIDCHHSRSENNKGHQVDDDIKKEPADSGDNSHELPDPPTTNNKKSKKDSFGWLFCAKNEEHSPQKMSLAKIIAGDCLEEVWTLLHKMRQRLNLGPCSCEDSPLTDTTAWTLDCVISDKPKIMMDKKGYAEGSHSTLKGLLLAPGNALTNGSTTEDEESKFVNSKDRTTRIGSKALDFNNEIDDESDQVYAAIEGCIASLEVETQGPLPINFPASDTKINQTHMRLCDGDLLVLNHSRHKENTRLFRQYWVQGKPVLVRDIHKRMNIEMWLPQFFSCKFGEYRSDLVDCRNGDIHRQSMRKYWDGFEPNNIKKRSKDDNLPSYISSGNNEDSATVCANHHSGSALWRLKDWPPGQDFMEILPEHYDDFMNNLPLSSYTTRTGRLNLACRLPNELLKPDLGPKMYSAYGTTKFPRRGTTNLHLDISDAVNVMVYVGGANPFNQGSSEYAEIFEKTVDECHVDEVMKSQIREQKLVPGAIWHIFKPSDVHKLRTFLRKISDESKISLNKKNDPIHDQTWYLDQRLLDRLFEEHGVKSYAILQCMGDAILIPAGAPHQVKNLQNCIKVANDFVSPENVHFCLKLTNEFRNLPDTHINQEDKLQIKNILYHSVKESIQYIDLYESGKIEAAQELCDEDDCEEYQGA